MNKLRAIVLTFAAITGCLVAPGCATTARGRAIQTGQVAKEVVDASAVVLRKHIEAKADECEEFVAAGEVALRACLGKVAGHPDEIDAAFEGVRAAQLGLYIALSDGSDPAAVKAARAELEAAVRGVVELVKASRMK